MKRPDAHHDTLVSGAQHLGLGPMPAINGGTLDLGRHDRPTPSPASITLA